jgi:LysR family transcriptional regulator, nod-box dependent transcriptional activator
MRFEGLDLNLLVALNALTKCRSVSAAARELHLTQSAMSNALERLREYFGDKLFIAVGRQMMPTPRALAIAAPAREVLIRIRATIATNFTFDASTSDRSFVVVAADYVFRMVVARALARASMEASGMRCDVLGPDGSSLEKFKRGDVDLLLMLHDSLLPDHPREALYEDELVCICWSGSPLRQSQFDEDRFCNADHIVIHRDERSLDIAEAALGRRNVLRRVRMRVPDFSSLPEAVIGTRCVAIFPKRQATYFARILPIRVLTLPFRAPPLRLSMQWHKTRTDDQATIWLRDHIRAQSSQLPLLAGGRRQQETDQNR